MSFLSYNAISALALFSPPCGTTNPAFLGQVPSLVMGKRIVTTKKTSELSVKEFAELLEKVDHYAGSELEIILTHPEDIYLEAMGR